MTRISAINVKESLTASRRASGESADDLRSVEATAHANSTQMTLGLFSDRKVDAIRWGMLLLAVAASVFATLDAWQDIFRIAQVDDESSHIRLVPLAAAWLLWTRRSAAAAQPVRGFWLGPLIALIGTVIYIVGDRTVTEALWHLGAVLMVVGAIASFTGSKRLLAAWPAVAVLLFLVPVPGTLRQQVALPLQALSAKLAAHSLELLGEPVMLRGNVMTISGFDVAVAEACNGMRMFFALALVAYLYAFLHPLKAWVRIALLLLSPLVALACNVFRLVPTAYMYGHSSVEMADFFHDVGGWAMLFVAYGILGGLVATFRWAGVGVDLDEEAHEPQAGARPRRLGWIVAGSAVLLIAGWALADRWVIRTPPPEVEEFHARVREAVQEVPAVIDAGRYGVWKGEDVPVPASALAMLDPNAVLSRRFRRIGGDPSLPSTFQFLVIHCRDARDLTGHYPPVCYDGRGFELDSRALADWPDEGLNGMRYEFSRMDRQISEGLHVFNFMLLPDGTVGRDMQSIADASKRLRLRERGAAQVQVVFSSPQSGGLLNEEQLEERAEIERQITGAILGAHQNVFQTMLGKKPHVAE